MASHPVFLCDQCSSPYSVPAKAPLSLPCGHVFCKECVRGMYAADRGKCPVDKVGWTGSIEKLPMCLPLLDIYKPKFVSCPLHPSKRIRYHCKPHQSFLCSICIITHTGEGHEVVPYSVTRENQRKETEAVLTSVQQNATEIRDLLARGSEVETRFAENSEGEIGKIERCFETGITKLMSRKGELIDTLRRFQKDQMLVLELKREKAVKRLEALQRLYEESKGVYEGAESRGYAEYMKLISDMKGRVKAMEGGLDRTGDCSVYAYREGPVLGDLGELQEASYPRKMSDGSRSSGK